MNAASVPTTNAHMNDRPSLDNGKKESPSFYRLSEGRNVGADPGPRPVEDKGVRHLHPTCAKDDLLFPPFLPLPSAKFRSLLFLLKAAEPVPGPFAGRRPCSSVLRLTGEFGRRIRRTTGHRPAPPSRSRPLSPRRGGAMLFFTPGGNRGAVKGRGPGITRHCAGRKGPVVKTARWLA